MPKGPMEAIVTNLCLLGETAREALRRKSGSVSPVERVL